MLGNLGAGAIDCRGSVLILRGCLSDGWEGQ